MRKKLKYITLAILLSALIVGLTFVLTKKDYRQGIIVPGDIILDLPKQCSQQYFLKTENSTYWLIPNTPDRQNWPQKIEREILQSVRLIGHTKNGYSPCAKQPGMEKCHCDNYLMVDLVLKSNSLKAFKFLYPENRQ